MDSKLRETDYMTYIEPNHTADMTDQDGNPIQLTHDYEDYCVAVDLAIEMRGRHVASAKQGENTTVLMHWYDKEHSRTESFFGGTDMSVEKNGTKRILTSSTAEVFINDIKQNTEMSSENIGIESISIRYNNYMVPEVEVAFVDVRGASLFMPEEYRHNLVGSKSKMTGVADMDISGAVFRSFFTFPYPKYTLVVKGFYGQPVSYMLSCTNFTSELDQNNGNFVMRATFVGFSFAFLNDISYNTMICAPNSTMGGEYWDQRIMNGEFTLNDPNFGYGIPMKKISEIIESMKGLKGDLAKVENDDEVTIRKNHDRNNKSELEAISKLLGEVNTCMRNVAGDESNDGSAYIENGTLFLILEKGVENFSGVNHMDEYLKKVYEVNYKIDLYNRDYGKKITRLGDNPIYRFELISDTSNGYRVEDNKFYPGLSAYVSKNNGKYTPKKRYVYSHNVSYTETLINTEIRAVNESIEQTDKKVAEMMTNVIVSKLQFTPSILNLSKILVAHMETLIYMIHETSVRVEECKRSYYDMGLDKVGEYDFSKKGVNIEIVPPFPQIGIEKDGGESVEDAWLEDIVVARSQAKEVDLVNDLLNGVKVLKSSVDEYMASENTPSVPSYNVYCKYPILPIDYLTQESPFGNAIDFNDWTDIAARIYMRFQQVYYDTDQSTLEWRSNVDGNDQDYFNMCGVIDAYNLTEGVKLPNNTLSRLDAITTNDIVGILNRTNDNESKEGVYAWDSLVDKKLKISELEGTRVQGYTFNRGEETENGMLPYGERYANGEDYLNTNIAIIEDFEKLEGMKRMKFSTIKIGNYDVSGSDETTYSIVSKRTRVDVEALYKQYKLSFFETVKDIPNLRPKWSTVSGTTFNGYEACENKGYILPRSKSYINESNKEDINNRFKWEENGEKYGKDGEYDIRDYGQSDVDGTKRVMTDSDFQSITDWREYARKYTVTKADSFLSTGNREIGGSGCIFAQDEFYGCGDIYERAYMFLSSNNIYFHASDSDRLMDAVFTIVSKLHEDAFNLIPKSVALHFGASLKQRKTVNKADFTQGDKNMLVKYFEDWVENEYKSIEEDFALKNPDGSMFTKDDLEKFIKLCIRHQDGKIEPYEWLTTLKGMVWDGFFRNYEMVRYEKNYTSSNYFMMFFRENEECTDRITELMLRPVLWCTPFRNYYNVKFKTVDPDGDYAKKYISGLLDGLKIKYKENIEQSKNVGEDGVVPSSDTPKDVKIALYKWLKLFYDRWLGGLKNYDDFKLINLINENDVYENTKGANGNRFYFIDSHYNKIGDKLLVNMDEFIADTIRSQSADCNSFMTMYGKTMQKNRIQLFMIPNFLDMSNSKEVETMFKPIPYVEMSHPDSMDCVVGVYCSEPSSKLAVEDSGYKDDSYDLTIDEELPRPLRMKDSRNGYKIPAFGVSYGGQYQSYFTDIKVGMDSSMATEQSIKAQFMIADMSKKDGDGENGRNAKYVGQDLYTVYANNSYKCTVTMMGCAWVRPTMYFVLLNVPMFRGTYMVHNVTHQIRAGEMTTTIVGTRMPRVTTPIVNTIVASSVDKMATMQEIASDLTTAKGAIKNDCGYKKFPFDDSEGGVLTKEYLSDTPVNTVAKQTIGVFGGDVSVLDALARTLNAEAGNQGELGQQLVATVFYNRWMLNGRNFDKLFVKRQIAFTDAANQTVGEEKLSKLRAIIEDVFTKTPAFIAGKTTEVDKSVEIWVENMQTSASTEPKVITIDDLQEMYMYCTTRGYSSENTEEARKNGAKLESNPEYWRKCKYILHHKGHVFTGGPQPGRSTNKKWTEAVNANAPKKSKTDNEKLFDCLSMTCEHTETIGGGCIKYNPNGGDGCALVEFKEGVDNEKMATVFDAFATTYYDTLSTVQWVISEANNSKATCPSAIRYRCGRDGETDGGNRGKNISMVMADKGYSVYEGDVSTMSENYQITLNKLFGGRLKEASEKRDDAAIPSDISYINGTDADGKQSRMAGAEAIVAKGTNIAPCPVSRGDAVMSVYRSSDIWTWDGTVCNDNAKMVPNGSFGKSYDVQKAISTVTSNESLDYKHGGRCAEYVRKAMEAGFGIEGGTLPRPMSACRYSEWMEYYGFKMIGEGQIVGNSRPLNEKGQSNNPSGYANGYSPKEGDIIIISGMNVASDKKKHGHIQMYANGSWRCDVHYPRIYPYSETGRPYKIYRYEA